MIDLVEKISYGFCAVVVLVVGTLYAFNSTPPTTPREFVRATRISATPPPVPAAQRKKAQEEGKPAPTAPTTQERLSREKEIRKALAANGVSARNIKTEWATVPRSQFDIVRNRSAWTPELNLARSSLIQTKNGPTRMKLTKIAPNSYLRKTAQLEEGDIIELIDGQALEYNDTSSAKYWSMAGELFDRLENGGEVSLTLKRGDKTIHRVFRVGG